MEAKSVLWIVVAIVALVIGVPVLIFIWKNFKAGMDDGEKALAEARAHPAERAQPVAADSQKSAVPVPAAVDFGKLDFSSNTVTATDKGEHRVEKLPPLKGSGKNGSRDGFVQQGNFEVRGSIGTQSGALAELLPSSPHSGGKVTLELSVEKGAVRAYLLGLDGSFVSGFVFVEATPGHPGRVTGYLQDWSDTGSPHQDFYLESRDGEAQGIVYRVYRKQ